jgi:hypothetical protein
MFIRQFITSQGYPHNLCFETLETVADVHRNTCFQSKQLNTHEFTTFFSDSLFSEAYLKVSIIYACELTLFRCNPVVILDDPPRKSTWSSKHQVLGGSQYLLSTEWCLLLHVLWRGALRI